MSTPGVNSAVLREIVKYYNHHASASRAGTSMEDMELWDEQYVKSNSGMMLVDLVKVRPSECPSAARKHCLTSSSHAQATHLLGMTALFHVVSTAVETLIQGSRFCCAATLITPAATQCRPRDRQNPTGCSGGIGHSESAGRLRGRCSPRGRSTRGDELEARMRTRSSRVEGSDVIRNARRFLIH